MFHFTPLEEDHLELVLLWRTREDVTRYMFTDVEYNLDQQKRWFSKVYSSPSDKYWVISINNRPIGLICLNQLDYVNRRTSWGFYIGEEEYRMYGALIPPHLYNYVFDELQLNKITVEVMEGNENMLKIHKLHGYRDVGIYEKHIYKYNRFHDIYIMELTKDHWALSGARYKKYRSKFD